jgi:hypothetical protein
MTMATTETKKQLATQPAKRATSDKLLVIGTKTVVLGNGERVSLSGELTPAQREQLGDAKVQGLHTAGHLQTQEQLDEADRVRQQRERIRSTGIINPNFGTPSMTPEAALKYDAPALGEGARQREPDGDGGPTATRGGQRGGATAGEDAPVESLGLETRTLNSLKAGGLNTIADVLRYGDDHDGLQSLEGIGEGREGEVQEAIDKALGN